MVLARYLVRAEVLARVEEFQGPVEDPIQVVEAQAPVEDLVQVEAQAPVEDPVQVVEAQALVEGLEQGVDPGLVEGLQPPTPPQDLSLHSVLCPVLKRSQLKVLAEHLNPGPQEHPLFLQLLEEVLHQPMGLRLGLEEPQLVLHLLVVE